MNTHSTASGTVDSLLGRIVGPPLATLLGTLTVALLDGRGGASQG